MKALIGSLAAALLLGMTGCAVESRYGGAYGGVYGEYPSAYYGGTVYAPGYIYVHRPPYDRDHYWDRGRYWERGRWHHGGDWHRHDWDDRFHR